MKKNDIKKHEQEYWHIKKENAKLLYKIPIVLLFGLMLLNTLTFIAKDIPDPDDPNTYYTFFKQKCTSYSGNESISTDFCEPAVEHDWFTALGGITSLLLIAIILVAYVLWSVVFILGE